MCYDAELFFEDEDDTVEFEADAQQESTEFFLDDELPPEVDDDINKLLEGF